MRKLFINSNSRQLAGILHQPAVPGDSVIIMCHGFRGSKDGGGRAVTLAQEAALMGFSVLRFDFTPCQTLTRQITELASVVEYCREYVANRIIILGRSMGGSAALAYAAGDQDKILGLCLWATPCNLNETFRLALGEDYYRLRAGHSVAISDEYGDLTLNPEFVEDFNNYDLIACVDRILDVPLLQIHGDCDNIVPLYQAQRINNIAGGNKKLIIIKGGDHQLANHYRQAADAVLTWLQNDIH